MRYPLPSGQRGMTRQFEATEVGAQCLIEGVRPFDGQTVYKTVCYSVSPLGEKLTARTTHPMTPKRNPNAGQKRIICPFWDHGFFDGEGQVRAPVERSPPNAVRKSTC